MHYPILSDPTLRTIRAYGVADEDNGIAWPTLFLVDKDGTIRWRGVEVRGSSRDHPACAYISTWWSALRTTGWAFKT